MSWKSLYMVVAVGGGTFLSLLAIREYGFWYLAPFALFGSLFVFLQRRWSLAPWSSLLVSVAWPTTLIMLPYMVVVHERARRERIVREIMET